MPEICFPSPSWFYWLFLYRIQRFLVTHPTNTSHSQIVTSGKPFPASLASSSATSPFINKDYTDISRNIRTAIKSWWDPRGASPFPSGIRRIQEWKWPTISTPAAATNREIWGRGRTFGDCRDNFWLSNIADERFIYIRRRVSFTKENIIYFLPCAARDSSGHATINFLRGRGSFWVLMGEIYLGDIDNESSGVTRKVFHVEREIMRTIK